MNSLENDNRLNRYGLQQSKAQLNYDQKSIKQSQGRHQLRYHMQKPSLVFVNENVSSNIMKPPL